MKFQALRPWLDGNESISPINFYMLDKPYWEFGSFLSLDESVELYKADTVDSGNLEDSWRNNQEYILRALEIAQYKNPKEAFNNKFDLDHEEKYWILSELGDPPYCSYNIYIITIYNDSEERIVYIGKTDSKTSRFKNGHKVALRLQNPKYKDYNKRIYFGTITFLSKEKIYIPLEFIHPLERSKVYLGYFEGRLINHFKPELNVRKEPEGELKDITIHIQNFSGISAFLHDYFVI